MLAEKKDYALRLHPMEFVQLLRHPTSQAIGKEKISHPVQSLKHIPWKPPFPTPKLLSRKKTKMPHPLRHLGFHRKEAMTALSPIPFVLCARNDDGRVMPETRQLGEFGL